jgi:tetratricopeptide (TPR) repeat protein
MDDHTEIAYLKKKKAGITMKVKLKKSGFGLCIFYIFYILLIGTSVFAEQAVSEKNIFIISGQASEYMNKGDYKKAIELWQKVLDVDNRNVIALNSLANCQVMLKKYDAALENYTKADKISQNIYSRIGIQLALILQGKYSESIAAGQNVFYLDPDNYIASVRIALAGQRLNDGDQAGRERISNIVKKYGSTSQTYYDIAMASYYIGFINEGNDYLIESLKIDSTYKPARQTLGLWPVSQSYYLTPAFQYIDFQKSSSHGSGLSYGGIGGMYINDAWNLGAGYNQTRLENLKSTVKDEFNQMTFNVTYTANYTSAYSLNVYYYASNSADVNNAMAFSGTFKANRLYGFSMMAGGFLFPSHSGGQISPSYSLNLGSLPLSLEITGTGQVLAFQTQAPPPPTRPGGRPGNNQNQTITTISAFGAVDGGLYANFSFFSIGAGGRFGSLYTPFFQQGFSQIYNLDTLNSGFFAVLRFFPLRNLSVNALYSYDTWSTTNAETPVSHLFSINLTMRFP